MQTYADEEVEVCLEVVADLVLQVTYADVC
jgi:hypothetical protein